MPFLAQNPAGALRAVLTSAPVAATLRESLSDDELAWLSSDVLSRPLGLIEFATSHAGRIELRRLIQAYQATQRKPAAIILATEQSPQAAAPPP